MSEKLLVFIPCYNCAQQIARVLRQFDEKTASYFSEILILDNGSKDNTVASAIEAAEQVGGLAVTVGKNHANYNLGGSHKAAFRYAIENDFSHVVVLHGDDQGNISDLLPVLERQDHHAQDACLGARFTSGSKLSGYSNFRIFGNKVFNLIFTIGSRSRVLDLGSGLNIFNRRVMEDDRMVKYADDLRFNIYLLLGMFQRGMKVEYFPISWREEDQISNVKMTSQALKTLELLWLSIADKHKFWEKDHRQVSRSEYRFDVVYQK